MYAASAQTAQAGVAVKPRRLLVWTVLGVLAWCTVGTTQGALGETAPSLREVFLNPPDEAKPRGYWVWPHGNFDYSALRHELAEFKAKGLGGVDIFDLGVQDRKNVIPPGPGFMSAEQVDGIALALEEAKRLGLKMGLVVSSSWNAGGSWTPPELAMMNLVAWKETNTGPTHIERGLPFPELPDKFTKPYGVRLSDSQWRQAGKGGGRPPPPRVDSLLPGRPEPALNSR